MHVDTLGYRRLSEARGILREICAMTPANTNSTDELERRSVAAHVIVTAVGDSTDDVAEQVDILRSIWNTPPSEWMRRARNGGGLIGPLTFAERAKAFIGVNYAARDCLASLARREGVGLRCLDNIFRNATGTTLRYHLLVVRTHAVVAMLCQSRDKVEALARAHGFGSVSSFYRTLHSLAGSSHLGYRDLESIRRTLGRLDVLLGSRDVRVAEPTSGSVGD